MGSVRPVQPMAARLGVDHQRLQQFITSPAWDYVAARRNIAPRVARGPAVEAAGLGAAGGAGWGGEPAGGGGDSSALRVGLDARGWCWAAAVTGTNGACRGGAPRGPPARGPGPARPPAPASPGPPAPLRQLAI